MSRPTNRTERRRLSLKRETLRKLSVDQLGQVAGGTSWDCSDGCFPTEDCTTDCWYTAGSRYC